MKNYLFGWMLCVALSSLTESHLPRPKATERI
jgi:hypothetical protein